MGSRGNLLHHTLKGVGDLQLQIANAFEGMVEQVSPAAHRLIRAYYDRYGLNLSKLVNTERLSNLTYVAMKPLEWVFLTALYAFYVKPEEVIKRQYRPQIALQKINYQ